MTIKIENEDLEKQVNNSNRMRKNYAQKLLITFAILFIAFTANAQKLEQSKEYIINNIKVTGVKTFNEQTVVTFAGLRKGQSITYPSQKISAAIKKLWKLTYFKDVRLYVTKVDNNLIDLELNVEELPKITAVTIKGVKKQKGRDLLKETDLKKGKMVTENLLVTSKNYIAKKYIEKGFLKAKVTTVVTNDSSDSLVKNGAKLAVNLDKGKRVKVKAIRFHGVKEMPIKKLKKAFKNTKEKNITHVFKASKYVKEKYKEDLTTLIDKFKEKGYRDARVIRDSVSYNDDNTINIDLFLEEGRKHYFGDIKFVGNAVYSDRQLNQILHVKRGDVYNGVLLEKRIRDDSKPDANDVSNLYQNSGYLFSNINTIETGVEKDTINFEIRIHEGKPARFDRVTVKGNKTTNDHVIYRNIRTKPGALYKKSNIIRTIRELGQVGFFDAEHIVPNIKNANPADGTVDVEYEVAEKGSSQVELSGGYGGTGFIGTLALSFNNFSIKNIFNKKAYHPVPLGDGQRISLRLQASTNYSVSSFSFSEPWLGGKKPVNFSVSYSHTAQFRYDWQTRTKYKDQKFAVDAITVGIAKRLKWPDDYFTISHSLTFQKYNLKNYNIGLFTFGNGYSNNINYTLGLSRDDTYTNPVYPMGGSKFALSLKLTPPHTALGSTDFSTIYNNPEFTTINGDPLIAEIDQKRFGWLEYYKMKFNGEWYTNVTGKFVIKTAFDFGFLGAYNKDRGVIPFERFQLGGSGLNGGYNLASAENIALRGYADQSLSSSNGGTVYNKFSMEMRYPLTLKPQSSIYALAFVEGGAAYDGFENYNPFQLYRSAGAGIRIFMPMFGLLGIDFGHGFDATALDRAEGKTKHGWETHFILGKQF